ncbi:hypothetical protein T484DRAFT_1851312 [Baffinella frigidus]|nr:hypothetical protein T484DRAFT_1851312 [Cryptophyta sp. CCMP2293]
MAGTHTMRSPSSVDMADATSARRRSLAAAPPVSESRPHHCNRDSFRRRRNSLACLSVETSPAAGVRATTAVAQLLHDAPQGIKDALRRQRLSLPISEVPSPQRLRWRLSVAALRCSIAMNKRSTAPARLECTVSPIKYVRRDSTTSQYVSEPDVFDSVVRRTRQDHPRSLSMLVRHDTLKLAGKSEREWERGSLRNITNNSTLLGAAHMLTLDTGLTLM